MLSLPLFVKSSHCTTGVNCQRCRDQEKGRRLREAWGTSFAMPENAPDFACPFGKPWGWKTGDTTPTPPRRANKPPEHWGPKLWAELHQRPRHWQGAEAEAAWLKSFTERVKGGCDCRDHWRQILDENPPDLSSADAYFAWGVHVHNVVNTRLRKPRLTAEQARERWATPA